MAETIQVSITAQDILSLKQSCQVIISEFKKYAGSILSTDEMAIYPLMLDQVKGLRVDVEAGKSTLDAFDRTTLGDIEKASIDPNNLSSFKDIENISGNYSITPGVLAEAKNDVKKIFDGLKHRESPVIEEKVGSGFKKESLITKKDLKYSDKNKTQSLPGAGAESSNPNARTEENTQAFDPLASTAVESTEQGETASYKSNSKGKFLNTLKEECIPCSLRLPNLDGLKPSIELLAVLEDLVGKYKELIKKLKQLLTNTEMADDICSLLNFLDFQCLPDLFSIIILLTTLMNKYRDVFFLNADGIFLQFIGPFFSPLLNGLSELLDKYIQLIMGPIDCIVNALDAQLSKLDVERALDQAEVQNISFHRKREGYLRRKLEQLEERRAFLLSARNEAGTGEVSPKVKIGGNPRSSQTNALRNALENSPETGRGFQVETSIAGAVSINEELDKLNSEISATQSKYDKDYAEGRDNNIGKLTKESQVPRPNIIGNAKGALRDARQGLNSSLYELRGQILNGKRMINDTMRVMRDELQRLIAGRAATSEEMMEGARNIQRIARIIGIVNTLIQLAKKGKICENNNSDPSVALGAFLTANKGTSQSNNYYNVFIGENSSGNQSLLIAPSDAVLELADPETDEVTQINNLDEINKLNSDGIPKNIGDITDKKITATVTDLGFQTSVSVIEFDLCKNSGLSTQADLGKIKDWAVTAGFTI